jgi:hypothetical protein
MARRRALGAEVGVFVVDDASGRINGLRPGSRRYLTAARRAGRWRVLFRRGEQLGAVHDLVVPAGQQLLFYVARGGRVRSALGRKPRSAGSLSSGVFFLKPGWGGKISSAVPTATSMTWWSPPTCCGRGIGRLVCSRKAGPAKVRDESDHGLRDEPPSRGPGNGRHTTG